MEKTPEIVQLLVEIRDQLREGATRQSEVLEFLRTEAARTKAVVDRSISLQELAVQRQRSALMLVVPIIVICLGVLAWIIFNV